MRRVTRREFLKVAGLSGLGAVAFSACGVPEDALKIQSPVRLPEDLVTGFDNWYATVSPEVAPDEGIIVRVVEGRAKKVEGNPDFPTNVGKTSVRAQAAVQSLYHPDRIRGPQRRARGASEPAQITWEEAVSETVGRLRNARASAANALLITPPLSGHANLIVSRFARAYGLRHLALEPVERTVEREAVRRVFGQDRFPYFDIANAHYLLSFGADFLSTWLSPVLFSRQYGEFRQGHAERGTFVQVDARFSMSAANADEWVPVRPGAEGALALGIAQVLVSEARGDAAGRAVVQAAVPDLDAYAPEQIAGATGVRAERIRELAHAFADNQPALAIAGGSAAAHANGLFNVMAALLLNVLVGNIGREGGVFFNPAPPMADVPPPAPPATFRQWQEVVGSLRNGQVPLVLVYNADPVHDLANLDFGGALGNAAYIISFSNMPDDTTIASDLVLPSRHGLESWGTWVPEVGPGYQTVAFQQPVVQPLPVFDNRAFTDVLLDVAARLELGLPWRTTEEAVRNSAQALFSRAQRGGSVQAPDFASFWVGVLQRGGWWDPDSRPAATPPTTVQLPAARQDTPQGDPGQFPLALLPFESNSLGAGALAAQPWLQAAPDPITSMVWTTWAELNPATAQAQGIREGDVLVVETPQGSIEVVAYINPATPPDVVGVPIGQGHRGFGRYATGRGANVMAVVAPVQDQETGALAWASTRARVRKVGRRVRVPKFEGNVPAYQLEHAPIGQVTPGNGAH